MSTVRTTASGVCGTMGMRVGLVTVSDQVVDPCTGRFDWSIAEHGRCCGGNGGGNFTCKGCDPRACTVCLLRSVLHAYAPVLLLEGLLMAALSVIR